jgi:hypothetical protein
MSIPPSTLHTCPVMDEEASAASEEMALLSCVH